MKGIISIFGGDLRIVKLVKLLEQEGFEILTFGLDKSDEIIEDQKCKTIEECLENSTIAISAIPFSKDAIYVNAPFANEQIKINDILGKMQNIKLVAGAIKQEIFDINKNIEIVDILKNETLTVKNAIPSAEGAIQIAMEESPKTIHGTKILVMGFGRIGKILSKMLKGIGAEVYCEARNTADLAWIEAYGYIPVNLKNLQNCLSEFDFIFNTIPVQILDETKLKNVRKDCLIVDVASNPGGVNFEVAKQLGIKTNWALGLPRKSGTRNGRKIY